MRLLALLPGSAAAVSLQRVVDHVVVVRVLPRQDARSTRAAQRAGHELKGSGEEEQEVGNMVWGGSPSAEEILTAFVKVIPASPISFLVLLRGFWEEGKKL